MSFLEVLVEHLLLKIYKVLIIHYSIAIFVTNPENSQKSLFVLWFELLFYRIVKWSYRVKNGPLRGGNYVNQIYVDFSRTLYAHLNLLKLLKMVV